MGRIIETEACMICKKQRLTCTGFIDQRIKAKIIDSPGKVQRTVSESMYACPIRIGLANALRENKKYLISALEGKR